MPNRRLPLVAALIAFCGMAIGVPWIERWLVCRKPVSEACVWAKAYLPLSFALWAVAGVVLAVIVYLLVRSGKRLSDDS